LKYHSSQPGGCQWWRSGFGGSVEPCGID